MNIDLSVSCLLFFGFVGYFLLVSFCCLSSCTTENNQFLNITLLETTNVTKNRPNIKITKIDRNKIRDRHETQLSVVLSG